VSYTPGSATNALQRIYERQCSNPTTRGYDAWCATNGHASIVARPPVAPIIGKPNALSKDAANRMGPIVQYLKESTRDPSMTDEDRTAVQQAIDLLTGKKSSAAPSKDDAARAKKNTTMQASKPAPTKKEGTTMKTSQTETTIPEMRAIADDPTMPPDLRRRANDVLVKIGARDPRLVERTPAPHMIGTRHALPAMTPEQARAELARREATGKGAH
jgi:hypothetical protein